MVGTYVTKLLTNLVSTYQYQYQYHYQLVLPTSQYGEASSLQLAHSLSLSVIH